jgi:phospholipid/cholesterol/gamma-HCH transport system substrate-binding protein
MSPLFRPLRERNPFWLGVVAAAVIVLLVLGTLSFGALGLGQARYAAEFAQSGDLRAGGRDGHRRGHQRRARG